MSDTPASALCPRCGQSSWAAIGKVLPFWLNASSQTFSDVAEGDRGLMAKMYQQVSDMFPKLGWGYLVVFVQCAQCGHVASATPVERLVLD
jgi:endogenous inhibitor of DNA gyrase (YacG/DUF329 family)